jgi:hypothetical protein
VRFNIVGGKVRDDQKSGARGGKGEARGVKKTLPEAKVKLELLPGVVWHQIALLVNAYLQISRKAPMALMEREILITKMSRQLCCLLLAEDAKADTQELRPKPCGCGGSWRSHGLRKRVIESSLGSVELYRRYYVCKGCNRKSYPLDEAWQLEPGCLSPLAMETVTGLGVAMPYREAHQWLERLTGAKVSLSSVWRTAQRAGSKLLEEVREQEMKSRSREGAAAYVKRMWELGAPGRWALAADGVFIRIRREWREAKVAVVGPVDKAGEWIRGQMSYLASTASAQPFRQRVVRHGLDRGITRRTSLALVSEEALGASSGGKGLVACSGEAMAGSQCSHGRR